MIREATLDDTQRLMEMGLHFVSGTDYSSLITFSPKNVAETILRLLDNQDAVVLVSGSENTPTGMIALMIYNHPFSGERMAFEVVWWIEPEARGDGVKLLKAAEEWAKKHGAQKMQMIAPTIQVGKLYERLGYSPVEVSYMRNL